MPTTIIDGQALFYAQHNVSVAANVAAVLIHGAGGNHLVWPAPLRRLPAVPVYALDLPGHGRSAGAGRCRIENYASVVKGFIDALGLRNVVVVGHSMGGAIALSLALQETLPLSALVLLGTGAQLHVNPVILDGLKHNFNQAVRFISEYSWSPEAPPAMVEKGLQQLSRHDRDVLYGDYQACDHFDVRHRLTDIALPVLIVSGTRDRMTPLKYGHFLAEQLPDAQLAVIEGGSHMMILEQPEAVAQVVRAFLEQIMAKGESGNLAG